MANTTSDQQIFWWWLENSWINWWMFQVVICATAEHYKRHMKLEVQRPKLSRLHGLWNKHITYTLFFFLSQFKLSLEHSDLEIIYKFVHPPVLVHLDGQKHNYYVFCGTSLNLQSEYDGRKTSFFWKYQIHVYKQLNMCFGTY